MHGREPRQGQGFEPRDLGKYLEDFEESGQPAQSVETRQSFHHPAGLRAGRTGEAQSTPGPF